MSCCGHEPASRNHESPKRIQSCVGKRMVLSTMNREVLRNSSLHFLGLGRACSIVEGIVLATIPIVLFNSNSFKIVQVHTRVYKFEWVVYK